MAVVVPDYRFIYTDAGAYGSEGDSTVFRESKFGQLLFQKKLNLPSPKLVYGKQLPFYFVGDDAFPLCTEIMKPFSLKKGTRRLESNEKQFNYRYSGARS